MTYAQLRTYILDRLTIATADTGRVAQVNNAINQARYRLNAEFGLKKATDTIDVTADTETATLPSDVVRILSLYSGSWLLQPITEQEFGELSNTVVSGVGAGGPQVYTVDGSSTTIRLRPIPSATAADYLTVHYIQRPTALSADGDIPSELPAEFHDLIAEEAIYRIAQNEEDQELARGAGAVAGDLRLMLRAYMNLRVGPTASRQALRGFTRG